MNLKAAYVAAANRLAVDEATSSSVRHTNFDMSSFMQAIRPINAMTDLEQCGSVTKRGLLEHWRYIWRRWRVAPSPSVARAAAMPADGTRMAFQDSKLP
jgi:hypothetical protein